MNSRIFLPLVLFFLLLIGGSYYYVCHIKQVCPESWSANSSKQATPNDSVATEKTLPLSFIKNSADPIQGDGFEEYINNQINRLSESDTLIIVGRYFDGENENIGLERAEKVKLLFADRFDVNRIKTQSAHDNIVTVSNSKPFEGVSYNFVKPNNIENPNTNEKPMVEIDGDKTVIHFPSGSVVNIITDDVEQYLDNLVSQLKQSSNYKVFVEGHTDNEGDTESNYQLGRKRAWVIKKYLMDKGLEPLKIITSSKGQTEPARSNDTEDGRAYNRRVILKIEKN